MKFRKRTVGFRPALDRMEPRALPSGAGANLLWFDTESPDLIFSDVGQIMDGWGRLSGGAWARDASIKRSAAGYALEPATAFANLSSYPDGVYNVSFRGDATVAFSGVGALAGPMTTGADGITRGTVVVGGAAGADSASRKLYMTITSTASASPMSDLHIWAPGYSEGGPMYTREFIASLKPFDFIRFLDWTRTNQSVVSSWSERIPSDRFGDGTFFVSYEEMIALANETGDDIWLPVPALADDDYLRRLAALVRRDLDPGLKVYVEYSNETWNYYFSAYNQVLAMAQGDPRVTATDPFQRVAQESALQAARVARIFYDEFGADSDRVLPVFSGFTLRPDFLSTGLSAVARVFGDPSKIFKATAIAPYGNIAASLSSSTDLSTLLASINSQIDVIANYMKQNVQVAAAYGLPLGTYEGGVEPDLVADLSVRTALINHPAMYDLYRKAYAAWESAGGAFIGLYTAFGDFWGLKTAVTTTGSPRWDGVMSMILTPGDADGDGDVDYGDFQVVAANMNRVGVWWAQGDFNHDGKVDGQDLALLRSNLDPASPTAAEAAAMAVRLAPTTTTSSSPVAFQAFAEKAAADFASATGGPIVKDGVYNGGFGTGQLRLGGVTYPRGLGTSSSSTITIPLGGLYTTFSSLIGVDDRAGVGSGQAVFKVIGDGRVLYTSPTMKAGASLPISVDVSGVSSLSLVVGAPSGTNLAIPADWAMARLVDARSSTGVAPSLTWTVTRGEQVISTLTSPTFVFAPAVDGEYLVTVEATDSRGGTSREYVPIRVGAPIAQATAAYRGAMLGTGAWKSLVGRAGVVVAGDSGVYPTYASVSVSGASATVWSRYTDDDRALAQPQTRAEIASAWTSDAFTIAADFTDGKAHRVTLYLVDWDFGRRSQRIDVVDAATGATLDSRTFSSFEHGTYASWDVSGSVLFRVTKTGGTTAAVSALFIDDARPDGVYAGDDVITRGAWPGTYGTGGQVLVGFDPTLPSYAAVSVSATSSRDFAGTSSDVRSPRAPDGSKRALTQWNGREIVVDVNLTDGRPHRVSLYMVDYNSIDVVQRIEVVDAATGTILDTRQASQFNSGVYMSWNVTGHVFFRIVLESGNNAVLSGVFIDDASGPNPGPAPVAVAPSAGFVTKDVATKGNWIGVYGKEGSLALGGGASTPSYAVWSIAGDQRFTWTTSTTDTRALMIGGSRMALTWRGPQFSVDVDLTDGQAHRVSFYMVDWTSAGRVQRIDVVDPATGAVLDSQTISSFSGGAYLSWNVTGSVRFRFTSLAGGNAIFSGIFFDAPVWPGTASFAAKDAATQGDWIGAYGGEGRLILNDSDSLPSYARVELSANATPSVWAASSDQRRVLAKSSGSGRQASTWSAGTFTVDVALTDGRAHRVSLYMLDYSTTARVQRIDVVDPATGAVLDSRTVSSFSGGAYLTWDVTGSVRFRFTTVAGINAVLAGVFFD